MAENSRLLRVEQVAERLGCCRRSVYGWIRAGAIDVCYVGPSGAVRVPERAVLALIRTDRPKKSVQTEENRAHGD